MLNFILNLIKKFSGEAEISKKEEKEMGVDLSTAPRGIRNNNPGNIDYNPINKWKGLNPKSPELDSRFCVFISPEYGIRALMVLLRNYDKKHNLNSIRQIINRWAPSHENDTSAYVKHVSKLMGIDYDICLNLSDRKTLISLAKAIVIHENGVQPYADSIYQSAYELI